MLGKTGVNVTTNGILLDSFFSSGCFEGSTAWNLAYFVDFVFNETVFVSSLDKMTCECIGPCVQELIR